MLDQVAAEMQAELASHSDLVPELFSPTMGGAHKLTGAQYDDYVRRNWQDPAFRQVLLQSHTPEVFLRLANRVHGLPEQAGLEDKP